MKLSDIKGDAVFEVIADLVDPITNIAQDKRAAKLWEHGTLKDGETPREFAVRRMKENLPYLLKEHKADLVTILAAAHGETVAEYSDHLNIVSLIKDTTDVLTDEVFRGLFTSAQTDGQSASSSSAPENTGE